MKISNFFLWCAGSDTDILNHCSKAERNKHIGFGTLVLVPAILAFISMSFALSTIEEVKDWNWLHFVGGFIWALIIFSFDRFIVSTHRRKTSNRKELENPAFYLRFGFAFILGIIISHPLVLMYFNGSISDQLAENDKNERLRIENHYNLNIQKQNQKIAYWDSIVFERERARNQQALIVAQEIDGEVLNNAGKNLTTGLKGKGPSAEEKIKQLQLLQKELDELKAETKTKQAQLQQNIATLEKEKIEKISAYFSAKDYLKREMALAQLKEKYPIVSITQWFLISLFILVDILPFIFKTFAPFGLYDKILNDDLDLIKDLSPEKRAIYLQETYDNLSKIS